MNILIVKPSSFGDIVHMLQVVEGAYREACMHALELNIHWIVRDCFADFLKCSPVISKQFIFERSKGLVGFFKLMQEVRKYRYDYVIDGQGLLRSGLMTFFAKGYCKIGRKDAREGSRLFYNEVCAPDKYPAHAIEILQALWKPLGLTAIPKIPLTLQTSSWRFPFPQNSILLFPDSRGPKKEWPYFLELTEKLLAKTDKVCVWLGQKTQKGVLEHPRFVNFIGKTKLSDLPLLMQRSACVIANDSGPIHLAAAMARPLVGIYGPTDSLRYGPYPTLQHCIHQAENGDLSKISSEAVLNSVLQQLS